MLEDSIVWILLPFSLLYSSNPFYQLHLQPIWNTNIFHFNFTIHHGDIPIKFSHKKKPYCHLHLRIFPPPLTHTHHFVISPWLLTTYPYTKERLSDGYTKVIDFPRYNMKYAGKTWCYYTRNISCSIRFFSTFHVTSQKFGFSVSVPGWAIFLTTSLPRRTIPLTTSLPGELFPWLHPPTIHQ